MLTCCILCRRPLRGRIVEPKNFPHIIVGSAGRAFHQFGGRGGPREAVAFGCGHCVLRPCSARMAQRRRRACFGALVRVWGRAGCAPAGGQHAAQCMAACPPPPRGAARVWVGASPRPSTQSFAWNQHLRHECTSCQSTFGCGRAAVRYLPSHTSCQGKFAAPPVGDEDAVP